MNILYEEQGDYKVGTLLADNDASLQVETASGKRAKQRRLPRPIGTDDTRRLAGGEIERQFVKHATSGTSSRRLRSGGTCISTPLRR